jgi:hypothetical protein
LAKENDELRQFSMDGYQISKSVSALQQDKDELTSQMVDKVKTI